MIRALARAFCIFIGLPVMGYGSFEGNPWRVEFPVELDRRKMDGSPLNANTAILASGGPRNLRIKRGQARASERGELLRCLFQRNI